MDLLQYLYKNNKTGRVLKINWELVKLKSYDSFFFFQPYPIFQKLTTIKHKSRK